MIKKIGLFDSGLGGLSILKALQQQLPSQNYYYIADSMYAPYGTKNAEFLWQRAQYLTEQLLKHSIDCLVVACNTATSYVVKQLREQYTLPIIGLEPAIKPATLVSQSKKIIVLATHNTLQSHNVARLIILYQAQNFTFHLQEGLGWVELVETLSNTKNTQLIEGIQQVMQSAFNALPDADTVVLGCTHYPFLLPKLQILYPHLQFIETSNAICKQVAHVLNLKLNVTSKFSSDLLLKDGLVDTCYGDTYLFSSKNAEHIANFAKSQGIYFNNAYTLATIC